MLHCEISQLEKDNTIWFHLYGECNEQNKQANKIETGSQIQRTDWQLSEGKGVGGLGEKCEGIKQKNP